MRGEELEYLEKDSGKKTRNINGEVAFGIVLGKGSELKGGGLRLLAL